MLTSKSTSLDLQLYAMHRLHGASDGRCEDDFAPSPIVPIDPSGPALVRRLGRLQSAAATKAALTNNPHGNRFWDLFAKLHGKRK